MRFLGFSLTRSLVIFCTGREVVLWAARRRHRYRVVGSSMEPGLVDGDFVLAARITADMELMVGDLVVARHPHQPDLQIIKRVSRLDEAMVWIASDNPDQGTDSRQWGPVDNSHITAKVTCVLSHRTPNAP